MPRAGASKSGDQEPAEFGTELYAVQMQLDNGVQRSLRIKLPGPEATEYHAVAGEYPYVFTLNKSSFDNAVLQAREELLDN